jgi:D-glycero-alpha-D-manno-heptose 1-phosphate guanylyltransferase
LETKVFHRANLEVDVGILGRRFVISRAAGAARQICEFNRVFAMNPPTAPSHFDSVPANTPAILLVGGLGTRLQSVVPSTPKPLARVGDAPFLELLVLQLRSQGIRHLVMCTGHLAGQIEDEFGDGGKWGVTIEYSRESQPLGTAGAVKLAERYLQMASEFLVMNGDSFLELDFREFLRFHRGHGGLISMAVRRVPDAARYGTVQMDTDRRVVGFSEKTGTQAPGIVNGGVYVFNRAVLDNISQGPSSFEKEVLPRLLEGGVFAQEQRGMFIDIGTPEDYARAQTLYQRLHQAAMEASEIGSQVGKRGLTL